MVSSSREKIGLWTAVIIGINTMIGAGIFGTTSLLGSKIGPAGIIAYVIAFTCVWFIAQSFARVAYLFPQEGSFYNYAKQWGGHKLGLAAAGAYICGLLTAMGLLNTIASKYIHDLIPSITSTHWGLITLSALVALNLAGAVLSKVGQYILIALTLYPLVVTTALCLTNIDVANLTPFMPYGIGSVVAGTKVALFGLFGFESVASLFNIVEQPEKSVPKALRISLLLVGIIYLLFIGSILLGIPQIIFQNNPNISIPQILMIVFPKHTILAQSVGISIIFAIMGTIHAVIWASSEFLLSYLKFIHSKPLQKMIATHAITHKTTVLLASGIILTAFLSIENLSVFFSITNVCLLFAFIASIASLLFIKQEWKSGQNYITLIGLISAFAIFAIALQTLMDNLMTWLK